MLRHAGELPSVVMQESMLQTLEIHFKFTLGLQTSASQQKNSWQGQDRLTENIHDGSVEDLKVNMYDITVTNIPLLQA